MEMEDDAAVMEAFGLSEDVTPAGDGGNAAEDAAEDAASAAGSDPGETGEGTPGREVGAPEGDAAQGAGDGASEGEAAPSNTEGETPPDDPMALRDHVRTQEGRLRAREEDVRRLQEELAALRAERQSAQAPPEKREAPKPEPVALPESLAADAAKLRQMRPEAADLLVEPGPDGELLRSRLQDFGVEDAVILARTILAERRMSAMEQGFQASQAQREADARQAHEAAVYAAHPELRPGADETTKRARLEFLAGMTAWIEGLPYRDASEKMRIKGQGTAAEVVSLVRDYKEHMQKTKASGLDADTRRRAEAAGMVHDHRSQVRPEPPNIKDEDAAIREAFGLKEE